MMFTVFSLLVSAFVVSFVSTRFVRKYAISANMWDVPNERSSHLTATPRGGGIAIVIALFAGLMVATVVEMVPRDIFWAVLGAGAAVAGIGFLDDRGHVSAVWRLVVHFAAAGWSLYWLGAGTWQFSATDGGASEWIGIIATAIAFVWVVNLFNFMDGTDGIAGGEVVFVAGAGAVFVGSSGHPGLALTLALTAVASAGFLVWNWPPAKIFMGDVGSGFVGCVLAILAYASIRDGTPTWTWLILMGVFLVDGTVTLLGRMARGDRWYAAHRSHAYQNAARRWASHKKVVFATIAVNVLWLCPLAWFTVTRPELGVWLVVIALSPLVVAALLLGAGREKYVPQSVER